MQKRPVLAKRAVVPASVPSRTSALEDTPGKSDSQPLSACALAQQSGVLDSRFCNETTTSEKADASSPDFTGRDIPLGLSHNAPLESDEKGMASWYGAQFHGRKTASGERFNRQGLTAAHRTLPFGTKVCVRSLITHRTVVVRINDRGPFSMGRVIDLSQGAAQELGMLGLGIKPVELYRLDDDQEDCPEDLLEPLDETSTEAPGAAENTPK